VAACCALRRCLGSFTSAADAGGRQRARRVCPSCWIVSGRPSSWRRRWRVRPQCESGWQRAQPEKQFTEMALVVDRGWLDGARAAAHVHRHLGSPINWHNNDPSSWLMAAQRVALARASLCPCCLLMKERLIAALNLCKRPARAAVKSLVLTRAYTCTCTQTQIQHLHGGPNGLGQLIGAATLACSARSQRTSRRLFAGPKPTTTRQQHSIGGRLARSPAKVVVSAARNGREQEHASVRLVTARRAAGRSWQNN
jgi:hypothetical protein